ncbi:MAG TPA: phage tail tube protein [Gemmatimonadales bacterium]
MPPISGKEGAIYLGSPLTKVADTYSWTLDTTAKIERASVKMDKWERKVPGRGDGTITVDRYIATTAVLTKEIADAVNSGEQLAFRLDMIDANAGFQQVSGTAYVSRGTIAAPHDDAARDTVELTLDGAPTFS